MAPAPLCPRVQFRGLRDPQSPAVSCVLSHESSGCETAGAGGGRCLESRRLCREAATWLRRLESLGGDRPGRRLHTCSSRVTRRTDLGRCSVTTGPRVRGEERRVPVGEACSHVRCRGLTLRPYPVRLPVQCVSPSPRSAAASLGGRALVPGSPTPQVSSRRPRCWCGSAWSKAHKYREDVALGPRPRLPPCVVPMATSVPMVTSAPICSAHGHVCSHVWCPRPRLPPCRECDKAVWPSPQWNPCFPGAVQGQNHWLRCHLTGPGVNSWGR